MDYLRPSIIPDLIMGESLTEEKGVFAGRHYNCGDVIIEFTGELRYREDLPKPYEIDQWVQVGPNIFMGPSGTFDDSINHSCDPSCALIVKDGKAVLKAIRPINAMMEITFDYSLTMMGDPWIMECGCGAAKCRGTIAEYATLPSDVRQRYEWLKIVPDYVASERDRVPGV